MTDERKEAFLKVWFDAPENIHWAHGMSNGVEKDISDTFDRAIAAWNTRPAPAATDTGLGKPVRSFEDTFSAEEVVIDKFFKTAATDTGLETVAWQHQDYDEWHETRVPEYHKNRGKNVRELVTRSQAEELLAAERAEHDNTLATLFNNILREAELTDECTALKADNEAERAEKEQAKDDLTRVLVHFVREHFPENTTFKPFDDLIGLITQFDNASTIAREYVSRIRSLEADNAALIHDLTRIKDHETELVNDNAAMDARIKELEKYFDKCISNETFLKQDARRVGQIEALEAKLAAAEKERDYWKEDSRAKGFVLESGVVIKTEEYERLLEIERKLTAAKQLAELVVQAEEDESGDPNFYLLLKQTAYEKANVVLGK